jgi:hypothetical protein
MVITVKDETFAGKILREIELEFSAEWVTVREIISERVQQEVEKYNSKQPDFFQGLVVPSDAEETLNGFKLNGRKLIDAEKQVYTALDAFQRNSFFVLVDNVQAETLEQKVQLQADTTVSFIKLTPLVGG